MKKFFAYWLIVSLICCLLFGTTMFVSASDDEQQQTYTTSDGITYSLSDFDIYIEDFAEFEFDSSQEVIDHIYLIGLSRIRNRNWGTDAIEALFGVSLTERQLELLILNPLKRGAMRDAWQRAIDTSALLYPNNNGDGELGNAFRHGYWVTLMYFNATPQLAIDFAVAHEDRENNPELHKTMDLFNDYAAYNYCSRT